MVDSEISLAAYVCVFLENATHFDITDSKSIKNLHAKEGEGGKSGACQLMSLG